MLAPRATNPQAAEARSGGLRSPTPSRAAGLCGSGWRRRRVHGSWFQPENHTHLELQPCSPATSPLPLVDTMSGCVEAWARVCVLCGLLLAAGAAECSEEETLLQPMPRGVPQPSRCLMECTATTYVKKLQLRDGRNIRLKDSTEGEAGEFCWSGHLQCTVGESFHSAFLLLPLDGTAAGPGRVEVRAPDGPSDALHTHGGPTTIGDGCGLRYDVTQHVGSQAAGTSFCVRVAAPEDAPGHRSPSCPPFLVTFWGRKQASQDGG